MKLKAVLYDEAELARAIVRISHEILEKNPDLDNMCLVGIRTRGVPLAKRIADAIRTTIGRRVEMGILDITFYRDDLSRVSLDGPVLNSTDIPFSVEGKNVVLVDDVLYTGRTARAAMEAIISYGRPASIQLAVLVDRGHRELPIKADFVGKNIPTANDEVVHVGLSEIDYDTDRVEIYTDAE